MKALVTGLPKKFLIEPGSLGKKQEVTQEVPGQVGSFYWQKFPKQTHTC